MVDLSRVSTKSQGMYLEESNHFFHGLYLTIVQIELFQQTLAPRVSKCNSCKFSTVHLRKDQPLERSQFRISAFHSTDGSIYIYKKRNDMEKWKKTIGFLQQIHLYYTKCLIK